jgi:ABC-type multidrug transport system permease subunit
MSAMFMIVLFFSFGGMPQLAMALQNRTIWFKHRDCNMYTALSYVWSMSIVQLPLSCMEALVFSSIAYFMIGFSTGALSVYPASHNPRRFNEVPLCSKLASSLASLGTY